MTVQFDEQGNIVLSGQLAASDAEEFLRSLLQNRSAVVDWRECSSAHAAVIQVLLVARPQLNGPPSGSFLRDYVEPMVT